MWLRCNIDPQRRTRDSPSILTHYYYSGKQAAGRTGSRAHTHTHTHAQHRRHGSIQIQRPILTHGDRLMRAWPARTAAFCHQHHGHLSRGPHIQVHRTVQRRGRLSSDERSMPGRRAGGALETLCTRADSHRDDRRFDSIGRPLVVGEK